MFDHHTTRFADCNVDLGLCLPLDACYTVHDGPAHGENDAFDRRFSLGYTTDDGPFEHRDWTFISQSLVFPRCLMLAEAFLADPAGVVIRPIWDTRISIANAGVATNFWEIIDPAFTSDMDSACRALVPTQISRLTSIFEDLGVQACSP